MYITAVHTEDKCRRRPYVTAVGRVVAGGRVVVVTEARSMEIALRRETPREAPSYNLLAPQIRVDHPKSCTCNSQLKGEE